MQISLHNSVDVRVGEPRRDTYWQCRAGL